ncbi:O-antigen ligase family protein [Devosia faecipullorum]|uniref:O-antigen ligase family protein n=1 Tax=Devosia faecipullorum TaxID=2755039 RepID=UPI00187BB025|nr:O-antigen ligase family protein [Devosia faecipullorum]MBE7733387.1 O-antigen ligase family protein [Devosia faecipullorum]
MHNVFSALLLLALIAGIVPPGAAAYSGAYVSMGIAAIGLVALGRPDRAVLHHPMALAILGAIVLLGATIPFVYRGEADLMAPVFVLPMLTAIGLGMIGKRAGYVPGPVLFALICLIAVSIALAGGAYEAFVLQMGRVGLGNNPIHYGSLAAMVGGLSVIGVVATTSPWRYIFVIGPILGVAATALSGSRGPLAGALAMAGIAMLYLLIGGWRDRVLRFSILGALLAGAVVLLVVMSEGSDRVSGLLNAMDIFRFTGGSDDIRAALFASALHALKSSPVFGLGFGQLMDTARALYPDFAQVHQLENLHADWANFAAMAGGIGLFAWLLLLLAPLTLLLDETARADQPIALGALILVTGQATLGVSNAMFGVVPQTMLYAVALGYLFARARRLSDRAATR